MILILFNIKKSLLVFFTGLSGLNVIRKNIMITTVTTVMAVELLLLAANINFVPFSFYLNKLSVFSEFFLGFLGLSLLAYMSLTAYNKRYKNVLLQFVAFSISVLIIFLMLLIIFNDRLTTTECISLDFFFFNSSFGESAKIATGLVVLIVFYVTGNYIFKNNIINTEYTIIILCAVLGLIIVINAKSFALIFLGFELQAIAIYALSSIKKNFVFSLESGLKYFILGSLSAGYFLFGWSLLYGITGLSMLVNFHSFFLNLFLYINGKISLESKNLLEIFYGTKNQTSYNYLELKQIKIIFLLSIEEFLLTIKTQLTVQIEMIRFLIAQQRGCCACKPEAHTKTALLNEGSGIPNKESLSDRKPIEFFVSELIDRLIKKQKELPEGVASDKFNEATISLVDLCNDWGLNIHLHESNPPFSLKSVYNAVTKKRIMRILDSIDFFNLTHRGLLQRNQLTHSKYMEAARLFALNANDEFLLNEKPGIFCAAERLTFFLLRKYKNDADGRVALFLAAYNYESAAPDLEMGKILVEILKKKKN